MRVRITLDVSDGLRRYIAANFAQAGEATTTAKGLAHRRIIREYLQARVEDLDKLATVLRGEVERPLSAVERAEAGMAVDYLRKQGKSDAEIRAWINAQHARLQFPP